MSPPWRLRLERQYFHRAITLVKNMFLEHRERRGRSGAIKTDGMHRGIGRSRASCSDVTRNTFGISFIERVLLLTSCSATEIRIESAREPIFCDLYRDRTQVIRAGCIFIPYIDFI